MNKDVKIGLAIGLLLLVGLFVWLAIISGEKTETIAKLPTDKLLTPERTTGTPLSAAKDPWFTTADCDTTNIATVEVGTPADPSTAAEEYLKLLRSRTTTIPADTTHEGPDITGDPTVPIFTTPTTYVVKAGDYLGSISTRVYGSARFWRRIAEANDIEDPSLLRPGMVLRIPSLGESDRTGPTVAPTFAGGEQIHVVVEGDTLSGISQKYYGTVRHTREILEANKLDDENLLRLGSRLRIPKLAATARETGTPAPGGRTYVVQEGDTLSTISQRFYGTARNYLLIMQANNIEDARALRVGQRLVIPETSNVVPTPGRESDEPGLGPGERRYVVREGDTLSDIASRELGGSQYYQLLMKRNNIRDEFLLRAGQTIILPSRRRDRVLSTEVRDW